MWLRFIASLFILASPFSCLQAAGVVVKTFASTKLRSEVLQSIAEAMPILSHDKCHVDTLAWDKVISTETPKDIEPDVAWRETWRFVACKEQYSVVVLFHPDSINNVTTFNLNLVLGQ